MAIYDYCLKKYGETAPSPGLTGEVNFYPDRIHK